MTSRLCGPAKVVASVLLGISVLAPSPLLAAERVCNGTLLQIQVNERGTSRSDRFRFLLGLDAENASKDAAMGALNARLAGARQVIQPLALARLTIPAPSGWSTTVVSLSLVPGPARQLTPYSARALPSPGVASSAAGRPTCRQHKSGKPYTPLSPLRCSLYFGGRVLFRF